MKNRVLFSFFLSISFLVSCQNKDPNLVDEYRVIVPVGYEGKVVIFHKQECEKGRIEFKDGVHYFYLPEDGVIFTKASFKDKSRFFNKYYNAKGDKIKETTANGLNDNGLRDEDYKAILISSGIVNVNYDMYASDTIEKLERYFLQYVGTTASFSNSKTDVSESYNAALKSGELINCN